MLNNRFYYAWLFALATSLIFLLAPVAAQDDFPRIVNLWGADITSNNYAQWGRYDYLIINGGVPNTIRTFKAGCRGVNPDIKFYSHTGFMFANSTDFWMQPQYWLYSSGGSQITTGWQSGYFCNVARDDYQFTNLDIINWMYNDLINDGTVEGLFFDMVVPQVTYWNQGDVDADRNGTKDNPTTMNPWWNDQQNTFFSRLRYDLRYTNQPYCMANDLNCGSRPYANGKLWEGERLMDPMLNYRKNTPADVIQELNKWFDTSAREPKHAFACMSHPRGWQSWRQGLKASGYTAGEIDLIKRDYPRVRQGLLTALMTDAYYFYDVGTNYYGNPDFWYDEFSHNLGQPLGPAYEITQGSPWLAYHWVPGNPWTPNLFSFTNAYIDGATGDIVAEVTNTANQYNKLFATTGSTLSPHTFYRVEATCQIEAEPTYEFYFRAHSPSSSMGNNTPYHNSSESQNFWERGIVRRGFRDGGATWTVVSTFHVYSQTDYNLEWWVKGAGRFRLKDLKIYMMPPTFYVRDFENGKAMINTGPMPVTVNLGTTLHMLNGTQAPKHILERDDWPDLEWSYSRLTSGWSKSNTPSTTQARNTGLTYDYAQSPGQKCKWTWTAPATGTYSVYACIPQVAGATTAARYKHSGWQVDINQSTGDGGWVLLFYSDEVAGYTYELELNSLNSSKTLADAIRVESWERYNNGAAVTSVTLPPYDGYILTP